MQSDRYEAVFYGALSLALMAWILFENALLYISKSNPSRTSCTENIILEDENRCLQLSDMRIPLVFVSSTLIPYRLCDYDSSFPFVEGIETE